MTMVLAGGEGRRLWPLTRECCKPALPFGGRHRTIDFTLSNCLHSGMPQVAVLAQYEAASLAGYLEHEWRVAARRAGTSLETWIPRAGHRAGYRGTADAVAQNLGRLDLRACRRVLILAGDHVYRMNYRALLADHVARGADVTVACVEVARSEAQAFGVVAVDGSDRIVGFEEKPAKPAAIPGQPGESLASMGIYVFETQALMRCLREGALDFGRNVLPQWITRTGIYAHRFHDALEPKSVYWRDVGTIDAYWQAHMELFSIDAAFDPLDARWPIGSVIGYEKTRGAAQIQSGSKISSTAQVHRSVVSAGVQIGHASVVRDCILLPGARVGAASRLTKIIVGRDCRIPDGTVLGNGAHAPYGTHSAGGVLVVTSEDFAEQAQPAGECVDLVRSCSSVAGGASLVLYGA
jgi:glucose-1-phosphate adenylyltransferase